MPCLSSGDKVRQEILFSWTRMLPVSVSVGLVFSEAYVPHWQQVHRLHSKCGSGRNWLRFWECPMLPCVDGRLCHARFARTCHLH